MATIAVKNNTASSKTGEYCEIFITPSLWKALNLSGPYLDVQHNGTRLKFSLDYINTDEKTALLLVKFEYTDGTQITLEPSATITLDIVNSSDNYAVNFERIAYMIYGEPVSKKPMYYVENPLAFANSYFLSTDSITVVLYTQSRHIEYVVSMLHDVDGENVKNTWRFEKDRNTVRMYHYEGINEISWLENEATLPFEPNLVAFYYTTRWQMFNGYTKQNFEYYKGNLPLNYPTTSTYSKYGTADNITASYVYGAKDEKWFIRFYKTTLDEKELQALGNSNGLTPLLSTASAEMHVQETGLHVFNASSVELLKGKHYPSGTIRQSLLASMEGTIGNGCVVNRLGDVSTQTNAEMLNNLNGIISVNGETKNVLQMPKTYSGAMLNKLSDTKSTPVATNILQLGEKHTAKAETVNILGIKSYPNASMVSSLVNPAYIEYWYIPRYIIMLAEQIEYFIELYPEEGRGMAFILERGNTGFYTAHITNSAGEDIDATDYEAKLYNDSQQQIASLPVIHTGTGWYEIIVDSSTLGLADGTYHLEFKATVGGYQILKREYLYVRFNA